MIVRTPIVFKVGLHMVYWYHTRCHER